MAVEALKSSFESIKGKLKLSSLVIGGSAVAGGLPAAVATSAAVAANAFVRSPKVVGSVIRNKDIVGAQVAKLSGLGEFYVSGSGSASPYFASLFSRVGQSITTGGSDEEITNNISALDSTRTLLKSPLKRTSEDFTKKQQEILDIVKFEDKGIYDQLTNAINKNEDVGPILAEISKLPAAKELFEDGIGFDGVVYDEQEKAQLEKSVADQPLISSVEKLQMIKQLRESGIIPNLDEAAERKPKTFVRAKKERPF